MGSGTSKQQRGERLKATKKKLEESSIIEAEQHKLLSTLSPETLTNMVESIEESLTSCSPFPEMTLLLAYHSDADRVQNTLAKCCSKVLTAPIIPEEHDWFIRYLFPSTIWFKRTKSGQFLYEQLMEITNGIQHKIVQNMDSIYHHLGTHRQWQRVEQIQNQSVITRQDHEAVGLLQEPGIQRIRTIAECNESKESETAKSLKSANSLSPLTLSASESVGDGVDIEDLQNFIDNNLAVNILMTTAKRIDSEFQGEMATILQRHGDFKAGPMKKVERALSKIENEYMDQQYPKAAKLLDIVRCSVSYNTADQLVDGFRAFMHHVESGSSSMELARVKNGFLDEDEGGYRDIKVEDKCGISVHSGTGWFVIGNL